MKKEKLYNSQFVIIMVIAFAIYLSNQMVQNTVTKYANTMSASTHLIGVIGGTFGIIALITRPFVGQVVDRSNHKKLLFASVGLLIVSNIVLVFATNPIYIIGSRAINGLAWGFGSTLSLTTAANALPKERLANGIGIYTLSQTLAQVIGPSIALYIIDTSGFKSLYLVSTTIMTIAFILVTFFKTTHVAIENSPISIKIKDMFAVKALLPTLVLMSNTMQVSAVASFLLIYADELNVTNLGSFFMIQALSILFTRPFIAKFINEKNIYVFTIVSEFMIIAGLLSLFFAQNRTYFIIAALLFGIGKSGSQPPLQSMCMSSVPQKERGKASNTSYAGQDLGQFIGAMVSGYIASFLGYRYAFAGISIIVTLMLIVFILFYMIPHLKKTNESLM